jgi:hypothetical protein
MSMAASLLQYFSPKKGYTYGDVLPLAKGPNGFEAALPGFLRDPLLGLLGTANKIETGQEANLNDVMPVALGMAGGGGLAAPRGGELAAFGSFLGKKPSFGKNLPKIAAKQITPQEAAKDFVKALNPMEDIPDDGWKVIDDFGEPLPFESKMPSLTQKPFNPNDPIYGQHSEGIYGPKYTGVTAEEVRTSAAKKDVNKGLPNYTIKDFGQGSPSRDKKMFWNSGPSDPSSMPIDFALDKLKEKPSSYDAMSWKPLAAEGIGYSNDPKTVPVWTNKVGEKKSWLDMAPEERAAAWRSFDDNVAYHDKLRSNYSILKSITDDQQRVFFEPPANPHTYQDAVKYFQDTEGASVINDYLRGKWPESVPLGQDTLNKIARLSDAAKAAIIKEDMTLFRGGSGSWHEWASKVGTIVSKPNFMSTSLSPAIAHDFGDFKYLIKAPKGSRGLALKQVNGQSDKYEAEFEVLLPPKTQLYVEKVLPEKREIHMRIVGVGE